MALHLMTVRIAKIHMLATDAVLTDSFALISTLLEVGSAPAASTWPATSSPVRRSPTWTMLRPRR
jgi:hypothetical protein